MSTRLILGTAQFGLNYGIANYHGQVSEVEGERLLQTAKANGIDRLDTAIAYGNSEQLLGQYGIGPFNLISKLPAVPEQCPNVYIWMLEQVNASLRRLKVPKLHGLLLHRPEQLLSKQGSAIARSLEQLRSDGLVLKTGLSIYSPNNLHELLQAAPVDLIQAPFNLLDQRLVVSGWLDRLYTKGIEVHTRSAFLQGLLLMARSQLPTYFRPWHHHLSQWYRWQAQHPQISAIQACLAFTLWHTKINAVVVGADNALQLQEIVAASRTKLMAELPSLATNDTGLIDPSNWKTA